MVSLVVEIARNTWLVQDYSLSMLLSCLCGSELIKDDLSPDFEGDATEIWHRVNTGWAMWKKAINFGRKQPQAVPEGFVLVDKHQLAQLMANMDSFGKKALGDDYVSFADIAAVLDEAQEPAND